MKKVNTDGRVEFCLVGDPVVTSLALPVALDALDDMIYILNKCENYGKDMFLLPLLKLNRIHSGSAIASSEELPFGIVSLFIAGSFMCLSYSCLIASLKLSLFYKISDNISI